MIRILFSIICILFGSFLTGCGKPNPTTNTIKIGAVIEQTGKLSDIATPVQNALTMSINDINAQGGINRQGKKYRVELVVEDTNSTPEGAIKAVKNLIKQDDVLAIIGPSFSQEAIPASVLAEDAKILLITPTATAPEVTMDSRTGKHKEYVFRTGFSDLFQTEVLAKLARDNLYKTAAIFYDASVKTLTEEALLFKNAFEKSGGKIVAIESFQETDSSFTAQLNRIKATKPNVLFLPVFSSHILPVAREVRRLGIQADILGTDAWNNPTGESSSDPALEGAFFVAHYLTTDPSPETQLFTSKYQQLYKKLPDDSAALSYDTSEMLFKTFEKTPTLNRQAIRDTLMALPPYKGVTGSIDYSELFGGEPLKNALILQIKNGKSVWVGYESP